MGARMRSARGINVRLSKVLAASERQRELADEVWTDRDGELLPDPAEEPVEENAFAPGASSRPNR